MTEGEEQAGAADGDRAEVLYERARAVSRAIEETERELDELAGNVRVALVSLRRARYSWGARSGRGLRRLARPFAGPSAPDQLEAAIAQLEALEARLTDAERARAGTTQPSDPAA